MRTRLLLLSFLITMPALSKVHSINYIEKENSFQSKVIFNYGLTYLGASLGDDHQDGGTYNRFKTGQDYKGDNIDYHASQQIYHAFSIGYKIKRNLSLNYSYTFQDDLNKNIKYEVYNKDGSVFAVNEREEGISYNNERVNLFISNIVNNRTLYFGMNTFYEMPTTETSQAQEMYYGLGIEPSIGFYSNTPGLYTGVLMSIQRNFYKKQQFDTQCGNTKCKYPTRYQTLLASISPYANYALSDKVTLKSMLIFDWDQQGDQVSTNEFNHNMDNIVDLGVGYQLTRQLNTSFGVEAALDEMSLNKSALKFNLFLTL